MIPTVQKVLILGGGSAGFMAALALKRRVPGLKVRLLRSKDIGIIGVGEGSTASFTEFLHQYLRVDPRMFHELARPTWKLGLKFLWGPRPYFHYTFGPGPEVRSDPSLPKPNGFFCEEDIECPDPYAALLHEDRVFFRSPQGLPVPHQFFSYHFENERFVSFLEHAAVSVGVEVAEGTVAEVRRDDRGVSELVLHGGAVETADLYVDCSGFASVLLGKALEEPFVSYKPSLFCERAVVGGWDRQASRDPRDQIIKPYTTCETMEAGWAWQIEHEHRINRGYVYCPDFITDEQAEAEFRAKNPLVGPTRVVRFVSGRYERGWVGNVVAVGNASGFVEPLEATALGAIGQQSRVLAESLAAADRQPRPTQAAMYNRFHQLYWDGIRNFLAVHYKFNTRSDSPFWRECREKTDLAGAADVAAYYQENGPDAFWGPTLLNNPHDQFAHTGYVTMLLGMKVPYRRTWAPTAEDRAKFETLRNAYRQMARNAATVREALAAIRSPAWKWA
jgi:tryptophan halogenase